MNDYTFIYEVRFPSTGSTRTYNIALQAKDFNTAVREVKKKVKRPYYGYILEGTENDTFIPGKIWLKDF